MSAPIDLARIIWSSSSIQSGHQEAGITIQLQGSSRAFSAISWSGAVSHQALREMWQNRMIPCPSLSAVEMSSTAAEESEDLPSPFVNISALVCDHRYLSTRFGSLVDNALVYISGFVVRQILRKLSCDVCRASLVTDALHASFDESCTTCSH